MGRWPELKGRSKWDAPQGLLHCSLFIFPKSVLSDQRLILSKPSSSCLVMAKAARSNNTSTCPKYWLYFLANEHSTKGCWRLRLLHGVSAQTHCSPLNITLSVEEAFVEGHFQEWGRGATWEHWARSPPQGEEGFGNILMQECAEGKGHVTHTMRSLGPSRLPHASQQCAKSLQSCPTLCDPMDCGLPGSSVHGVLQAKILEWVAMPSFSRASSQPRDQTHNSYVSCMSRQFL